MRCRGCRQILWAVVFVHAGVGGWGMCEERRRERQIPAGNSEFLKGGQPASPALYFAARSAGPASNDTVEIRNFKLKLSITVQIVIH